VNGTIKHHCNLNGIAKLQLLKCGISNDNIYDSEHCSFCEQQLFYSYRRDGITGRFASLIWLHK
jgi:copper oxidase (laccase) domain-containing protein